MCLLTVATNDYAGLDRAKHTRLITYGPIMDVTDSPIAD